MASLLAIRNVLVGIFILVCVASAHAQSPGVALPKADWLVDPAPYKAAVKFDEKRRELTLENGLSRRTLRLTPNAATIDYQNLVTGEQLLRSTGPEGRVTLN